MFEVKTMVLSTEGQHFIYFIGIKSQPIIISYEVLHFYTNFTIGDYYTIVKKHNVLDYDDLNVQDFATFSKEEDVQGAVDDLNILYKMVK